MIKFMFPARLKVIYAPEPECEDNTYQKPVTWNLGTLIKTLFFALHITWYHFSKYTAQWLQLGTVYQVSGRKGW